MADEPPAGVADAWATLAAQVETMAETVAGAPDSTIKPRETSIGSLGRQVLADFEHSDEGPRLIPGQVLGEGGRGVVRLARQTALGREVAIKALRPALRVGPGQQGPTLELLQEAWIAGRLEHPNIVPVYDIAAGDDGGPLIVLKRIEGESWAKLLADPERARALLGAEGDLLEAHLQVLISVCNAVDFAHDRGILHLDLKPDNVMIGSHGEVLLVDWGVAAALEDDGEGRLPLVAERKGIVGTPAYMAPEMAGGDGAALGRHSDVYLLGATLFEVLAGAPPHRGETVMAVLHAVITEEPRLPAEAPGELAEICRRAMARRPEERTPGVLALRDELEVFLRHRESL
ncbi:MAG: serine/threonine protein kinase, partial [Myxococcales bacterium]|nr:serine/threonine protein kinase [Myxococcales bacterium]